MGKEKEGSSIEIEGVPYGSVCMCMCVCVCVLGRPNLGEGRMAGKRGKRNGSIGTKQVGEKEG